MYIIKGLKSFLQAGINERILIYPFLLTVVFYITIYGIYVTDGFKDTEFDLLFLFIFIPIILIDVLKTSLECSASSLVNSNDLIVEDLKNVSVIIPTKDGAGTLANTLEDLLKKFKPNQIIVASNGSTDRTCEIARNYNVVLLEIEKPIGKIDAINEALLLVKTKYCLTMDDDVLIGNAIIPTHLLKNASGVALRVLPKIEGWVTQIQAHEYRKSMDIGKNFHNLSATVHSISGAIGLFRTTELVRQIKLHTGEFSGEDLQRTLLIHLAKKNSRVVLSESIVETEVPNTLWELYKQRVFGWGPGLLSNTGNLFKILFKKGTHIKLRYEAFYTLFLVLIMDPLRLIAIPILFWYPKITLIVYVVYVMLEMIPYYKLSRIEPLWVPFVAPLYGIFNFLARTTGALVFLYRRTAVFIANKPRFDDYRTVGLRYRLSSIILSCLVFAISIGLITHETKPIVSNSILENSIMIDNEPKEAAITEISSSTAQTKLLITDREINMGTWLWHSPTNLTDAEMISYIDFLQAEGFTAVYLDITDYIDVYESIDKNDDLIFDDRLKKFVNLAATKNIEVEALFGGTIWAQPDYEYAPPIILNYVINFNKQINQVPLAGIQFDIESYNLPAFADSIKDQEMILRDYLNLAKTLTTITAKDSPDLKIGFAVPFWFDNVTRDLPIINFNGTNQPVGYHLLDILNSTNHGYIVIMDYRNKTAGENGSIKLAGPQIDYANNHTSNVHVLIAQETTDVEPASITFYNQPETNLSTALSEIYSVYKNKPAFAGFAIHDIEGYKTLVGE